MAALITNEKACVFVLFGYLSGLKLNYMEKTIYNLELHEIICVKEQGLKIQRVPSGWNYIYTRQNFIEENDDYERVITHVVFVPYDNTLEKL